MDRTEEAELDRVAAEVWEELVQLCLAGPFAVIEEDDVLDQEAE